MDAVRLGLPHNDDGAAEVFGDAFDAAVEVFVGVGAAGDADHRLAGIRGVVPYAAAVIEVLAADAAERGLSIDVCVRLLLVVTRPGPGRADFLFLWRIRAFAREAVFGDLAPIRQCYVIGS